MWFRECQTAALSRSWSTRASTELHRSGRWRSVTPRWGWRTGSQTSCTGLQQRRRSAPSAHRPQCAPARARPRPPRRHRVAYTPTVHRSSAVSIHHRHTVATVLFHISASPCSHTTSTTPPKFGGPDFLLRYSLPRHPPDPRFRFWSESYRVRRCHQSGCQRARRRHGEA